MSQRTVPSNNPAGRPRSVEVTKSIHAAVWQIIERGAYGDLTMERIADTARISRPALYRRYAGVGQTALGSLLAIGVSTLPMPFSKDIRQDFQCYFEAVIASLEPHQAVGKALRGVLAQALVDARFAPEFAEFIAKRREPVRLRLLAWQPDLAEGLLDAALDSLFGPLLYRILIRQIKVSSAQISSVIGQALGSLNADKAPGKGRKNAEKN